MNRKKPETTITNLRPSITLDLTPAEAVALEFAQMLDCEGVPKS